MSGERSTPTSEWYEGVKAGMIRNKSGDRYKPASLRDYERNMRLRVLPELGGVQLTDLRRPDLQEFADGLLAARLDPSTIRTTFLPLRASTAAQSRGARLR